MADELFYIRPAVEDDLEMISYYAALEGMDDIPDEEDCFVAVSNQDGMVVGFVRTLYTEGYWYVNPIVVYESWRGWGVGRALMEHVMTLHTPIKLVARGASIPFYRDLDFMEMSWDEVGAIQTAECGGCEMRAECGPLPMIWHASQS